MVHEEALLKTRGTWPATAYIGTSTQSILWHACHSCNWAANYEEIRGGDIQATIAYLDGGDILLLFELRLSCGYSSSESSSCAPLLSSPQTISIAASRSFCTSLASPARRIANSSKGGPINWLRRIAETSVEDNAGSTCPNSRAISEARPRDMPAWVTYASQPCRRN
eukprot:scaffold47648_cov33-Tisochrysis_lutea.AAC.3